ncbi:hypothetical protein FGO68_gene15132 [Halteria grandinella]|uniref:Uncharacterized protein n=1 Tax=Halteria grandinella TaxID=5974 RepID=A0A8J8P4A1_HALGN|nr:hypothetical protein FGO68_gene15132 [Halteria grandinella]
MSTASLMLTSASDLSLIENLGNMVSSVSADYAKQVQFSIIAFGFYHTLKSFLSNIKNQQKQWTDIIDSFNRINSESLSFAIKLQISPSKFDTAFSLILHPHVVQWVNRDESEAEFTFEDTILQLCIQAEFLSKLRGYVNSSEFKDTEFFEKDYGKQIEASIISYLEHLKALNDAERKQSPILLMNQLTTKGGLFVKCDQFFIMKVKKVFTQIPTVATIPKYDSAKSTPIGLKSSAVNPSESNQSTKNNTPVQSSILAPAQSSLLVKRQQNQQLDESKESEELLDLDILLGNTKRVKVDVDRTAIEPPAATVFFTEDPVMNEPSEQQSRSNMSFGGIKEESFAGPTQMGAAANTNTVPPAEDSVFSFQGREESVVQREDSYVPEMETIKGFIPEYEGASRMSQLSAVGRYSSLSQNTYTPVQKQLFMKQMYQKNKKGLRPQLNATVVKPTFSQSNSRVGSAKGTPRDTPNKNPHSTSTSFDKFKSDLSENSLVIPTSINYQLNFGRLPQQRPLTSKPSYGGAFSQPTLQFKSPAQSRGTQLQTNRNSNAGLPAPQLKKTFYGDLL